MIHHDRYLMPYGFMFGEVMDGAQGAEKPRRIRGVVGALRLPMVGESQSILRGDAICRHC